MSLRDMLTLLEGETLCPEVDLYRAAPCTLASDVISDILTHTKEPSFLLTGLINNQYNHMRDMTNITKNIFIRDKYPLENLIKIGQSLDGKLIIDLGQNK